MNGSAIVPYLDLEQFERLDFDPETFGHEAHVYVGWELVTSYPLSDAIHRFSDTLRRLTRRENTEAKYHETITWFFMILIAERQAITRAANWQEFAQANEDLLSGSESLLLAHYSPERLWSDQARQQFLMPDAANGNLA